MTTSPPGQSVRTLSLYRSEKFGFVLRRYGVTANSKIINLLTYKINRGGADSIVARLRAVTTDESWFDSWQVQKNLSSAPKRPARS